MKIYGVLAAGGKHMDLVLSQTPNLLISGMYCNRGMKKFLIKHREEINSIIIDHGAYTRYRKNIQWSYSKVKDKLERIMKFLQHIDFSGDAIPIAPDIIKDSRTTIKWQKQWLKDFSDESICVYRGFSDGYKYFGITKIPKPSLFNVLHLREKGKLHGLGAKPSYMPFYIKHNFDTIDCTIDSNGWSNNRMKDFRSPIWEKHIDVCKKLNSEQIKDH